MQDEHHRAMEMLQRQLDHAEGELFRLQRSSQKSPPGTENEVVTEYIRDPRQTERPGAEVLTDFYIKRTYRTLRLVLKLHFQLLHLFRVWRTQNWILAPAVVRLVLLNVNS